MFESVMNNKLSYFGFFVLIISLSACSPIRIVSTKNLGPRDLRNAGTFVFKDFAKEVQINRPGGEQTKEYVKKLIVEAMESKGYSLSEEEGDILIDLDLFLQSLSKEQTSSYNNFGGRRYRYYAYNRYANDPYFWDASRADVRGYTQAVITITMAQAEKSVGFWEGVAEASLSGSGKKRLQRLQTAVDDLIARMPG